MTGTEVVVGYTSNRKKQLHFFDELLAVAKCWRGRYGRLQTSVGVRFVPLTDGHSPDAGLTLDAVIHKRTDDMAAAVAEGDQCAATRLAALAHFLDGSADGAHGVVAVDPLRGVWRLVDRRRISEAVDRAFGRKGEGQRCAPTWCHNVSTVRWIELPVRNSSQAEQQEMLATLNFPIILKRRLACGTTASHEMVIAYDMEGALAALNTVFTVVDVHEGKTVQSRLTSEGRTSSLLQDAVCDDYEGVAIAQEFIANHGGVLFKLYAIGTHVVVQPRLSVQHNPQDLDGPYYKFDSQLLSRGECFSFDSVTGCCKDTEAIMPSPKLSASIVASLSEELDLSLIGIDVVYDIHSRNYYVVDINYFPGYRGVHTANEWILDHICNLVWQRQEEE